MPTHATRPAAIGAKIMETDRVSHEDTILAGPVLSQIDFGDLRWQVTLERCVILKQIQSNSSDAGELYRCAQKYADVSRVGSL